MLIRCGSLKKGPKEPIILKCLLKSSHNIFLKEGSGWQRLNETLQTFSQVIKAISSKRLPFKKTTKRWVFFFNEWSRSLMNLWQYIKQIKKIITQTKGNFRCHRWDLSARQWNFRVKKCPYIYIHIGTTVFLREECDVFQCLLKNFFKT